VCVARAQGRPEAYPVKSKRLKRGARAHAMLWVSQGDRVWLVQRPSRGVWAGLWSLPEFASPLLAWAVLEGWPGRGEALPKIEHALTHFDWTLQPLRWQLPARLSAARLDALSAQLPPGRWISLDRALQMGLPAPVRKLLQG
jgi:A/G-specific adenine glycosylase